MLICVEANPALLALSKINVSKNAPGCSAFFENAAVDYSGATNVRLGISGDHTASRVGLGDDGSVVVRTTTLSDLVSKFNLGEYSLVCDIEGAEWDLLKNEKCILRKCRQMIIELHPGCEKDQRITVELMRNFVVRDHGFNLTANRGDVFVFER